MANDVDEFLADSVRNQPGGVAVIVDYSLERGTMRVPPDVFARLQELAFKQIPDELRKAIR